MRSGRSPALISGDANGYYAWIRSALLDGDLDFKNDFAILFPPDPVPLDTAFRTPRGQVPNKYPIGLAILELPGFLAGDLVARITGGSRDGASAPYQLGVTLWLQLLVLAGIACCWLAARRLGANADITALVLGGALLSSNLLHYVAKDPAMPHGPGMALLSAALLAAVPAMGAPATWHRPWVVGILIGFAVIVRPTNVAVFPFFLAVLWHVAQPHRAKLWPVAMGAAMVGCLQVGVASWIWMAPTFATYPGEEFTGGLAGVVHTLTASRHGLFLYHPWYLLMVLCCLAAVRRRELRLIATGALISFGALALINGTWWNWWFGDSFGNRAFIELIPVLVVPVALFLTSIRQRRPQVVPAMTMLTAVLAIVNVVLWAGFVLHRYPADGVHTAREAYLWMVPGR